MMVMLLASTGQDAVGIHIYDDYWLRALDEVRWANTNMVSVESFHVQKKKRLGLGGFPGPAIFQGSKGIPWAFLGKADLAFLFALA